MTRFKYYVIELSLMAPTECVNCGYRWNATKKTKKCPGCGTTNWNEKAVCDMAGGTCDLCGCEFYAVGVLNAKRCPNCGSKRWYHKATDARRRLEDVTPWVMEKAKGGKTYRYWMVSWREGDKVRNVHLGSCKKLDKEAALQKARTMKARALGLSAQ